MGKPAAISDFLVDTNGNCFICLSKASPQSRFNSDGLGLEPTLTPYSSAHALSRYLKMDMSKVFHERDSIPSDLLDNVKRSKLKVSLCEQCSEWNKKISELCRQLEKIETEVAFYLELLHGSLFRSGEDDKPNLLYKFQNDMNPSGGSLEKVRIVKALRTEARERCSEKLKTKQPKIKVRNLTAKQAFSKIQKIKSKTQKNTTVSNKHNEGNYSASAIYFSDGDHVKTEDSDRGKNDFFDDEDYFESMPMNHPISEVEDHCSYARGNEEGDNMSTNPTQSTAVKTKTETERQRTNATLTDSSTTVLPSLSFKVQKLTYEINPETGKFQCNICSVEAPSKSNLKVHYESVHLKIKHKCNICGKEFSKLSNYKTHHRTAHVGVKFKCNLCGQCFTTKRRLLEHQQCVHLGKRFQCQFCPKSFSQKCNMTSHVRASHRQ